MDVTRLSSELDLVNRTNAEYVDRLYQQYLRDPRSVDERWAFFFAGFLTAAFFFRNVAHGKVDRQRLISQFAKRY